MRDETTQRPGPRPVASGARGEDELANALAEGSPEAIQRIRRRVRRIVAFRGYRVPPEDRKDLEQEVMTQVWQAVNRSGFDAARGLWGFVEVVAARRCIDWVRRRRHEVELDENLVADDDSLESAIAGERLRHARAALADLAEPCGELVRLRVGRGMSYRELAERFGKSEGALRVQMHRCIGEARRALRELERGPSTRDSTG